MIISSEIRNYRTGRGAEVYITFPAASLQKPLRLQAVLESIQKVLG